MALCVSTSASKPANSPVIAKCKADLAGRLKLTPKDIEVISTKSVTWPSTALGMPEIGKVYAQALTPGLRLILQASNVKYLYTTSAKTYRYGGPVSAWSYSMLYIKPVMNEPNLNGDLYQCSLLSTNPARLISGVSDYYPQSKGMVIFKRRTSRSGHDLLYVRADRPGKETKLYGGFDFGEAAVNDTQDQWAGFVRPTLGLYWNVVISSLNNSAKAVTIPLPDDTKPGKIAWSNDKLMILVGKGQGTIAYETDPKAQSPSWKQVQVYYFPGHDKFILNKSESLEIEEVKEDSKTAVEIARVWFTGDRNEVAKISGLTLKGYDLIGPYAFVWGEKAAKPAAYSVDIRTGVILASFPGSVTNIKPFVYPPRNNPLAR